MVEAFDILVDEAGAVWDAGSAELHHYHNAFGSRVDLSSYLLRNLGHVRLRLSKYGTQIYLAFRPGEMSRVTVYRACDILFKTNCNRITVEYVEDPPYLQQVFDVEDAATILHDQITEPHWRRPKYFKQTLSLERLQSEPRLANCAARYRNWLSARGRLTKKLERSLLSTAKDRHTTTKVYGSYAAFETVGLGYSQIASSESKLQGRRVGDYPDPEYGGWVNDCTLEAAFHGVPLLEMVEITVAIPAARPIRVRHERLLLPWRGRGSSYVSSTAAARVIFPSHSSV